MISASLLALNHNYNGNIKSTFSCLVSNFDAFNSFSQMPSYSNFKTHPLQILVNRGQEKHQHVKNAGHQEKAIRKANAPQLAVDSSSS